MPVVTEINKQKRKQDRFNIYLDGEYAGSLNLETLVQNGIKAGTEVTDEDFLSMLRTDNEKYAFNLAIKYISLKRRTVFETKAHLLGKDIDEASADTAIEKVLSYGYLNDLAYAKEFVSYYINSAKFGRKTVAYKLKTKGVDELVIDTALAAYTEEIELETAKKLVQKMMSKYEGLTPYERKGKISRSLIGKGFSFETISRVLSKEEDE